MLALFGGCKADVAIHFDIEGDGGGVVLAQVVIDREAARMLGGEPSERLRFDDLRRAGWETDFRDGDSGGEVIELRRRFVGPSELPAVMRELAGETGLAHDVSLERDRSVFRSRYKFRAVIDMQGAETGLGGDGQLAGVLASAGVDQGTLQEAIRSRMAQAVDVVVAVDLPGDGDDDAPRHKGGASVWPVRSGVATEIVTTSSAWSRDRVGLLALSCVLGLAAIALLLRGRGTLRRGW